jgi:hypothetical protein
LFASVLNSRYVGQTFVNGQELKVDLHKLDEHYSALPEEVKASGLHKFADCPPEDTAFLVTRLWDTHLPAWRALKAQKEEGKPRWIQDTELRH